MSYRAYVLSEFEMIQTLFFLLFKHGTEGQTYTLAFQHSSSLTAYSTENHRITNAYTASPTLNTDPLPRGSIIVWRFKPILSAGLRFHSHLSGGLRLRNYRAVAENHKFSSRFSVFACFCGEYSN